MIEAELAKVLTRNKVPAAAESARQILLLAEGAVVMMLTHRDRCYVEAAAEAARRLMRVRGRGR
jgi:hypothetical protein